jgi:hypothetical protein
MADIVVAVAGTLRVVESIEQLTAPAAEAILAGAPVRFHTDGTFTNANGSAAGEAGAYGVATDSVAAGWPVTAIRKGVVDGYTFSQAYGAPIFLSNTDGTLADAAGTVSVTVGRITPAFAEPLGTAATKLLSVDVQN